MAGNLDGFDANEVEPNTGGFDPVPAGDYEAIATESEFKPTKDGNGEYLQITWEVIKGEFKGRTIWDRLNLKNNSDTAVKIAMGTLSAICHAVGIMKPKDSAELHGKAVNIRVELEERNDKPGSFSNRIRSYTAIGSAAKPAASGGTEEKKPPWKK